MVLGETLSPLQTLGFLLGTSFASGLNLYATVAALGLLQRYGVIQLPPTLDIVAHPAVLGVAIALYVIEFVADKIPYVDNIWDVVHTFIRRRRRVCWLMPSWPGCPTTGAWLRRCSPGAWR